jgi:hypothetical protein
MVSLRENAASAAWENDGLAERLCGFMRTHNLSLDDLAGLLRIEAEMLDHWLNGGETPPACLLALMVLFGARPAAQSGAATPHGSAFHSSRDLRLKGEHGADLLRRVRAI